MQEPVALFPLPNVVLFPQAVLPLHIFEPRYRAMTTEAMAGSQKIAIALLKPGFEEDYLGKAAIEPVVCVGKIVAHQKLEDGRHHMLLGGLSRARIVREVTEMPYRSAMVDLIDEPTDDGTVTQAERQLLQTIFESGPIGKSELARRFVELLSTAAPIGNVLDLMAFHFVTDAAIKQSVLNEIDPAGRFALLAPLMLELSRQARLDSGPGGNLN